MWTIASGFVLASVALMASAPVQSKESDCATKIAFLQEGGERGGEPGRRGLDTGRPGAESFFKGCTTQDCCDRALEACLKANPRAGGQAACRRAYDKCP